MTEQPARPRGRAGLGLTGEELAARHLEGAGYTIIGRRWRRAEGEIDLIARHAGGLVFVEVRTRRGTARGAAIESIPPAKAARLVQLAGLYLAAHPSLGEPDWRIDVVAVQMDGSGRLLAVEHIVSAVEG
jgi:putative endonuclease